MPATDLDATPPAPRRRMRRADRERQLLDVAERLLSERGYQDVTMEEIAEEAGVTKPILYHHFGSKEGLAAACIRRARAELGELTAQVALEAGTPKESLTRALGVFFTYISRHDHAWARLLTEGALTGTAAGDEVERLRQQQAELTAGYLAPQLPDHDPAALETYAQAIIGACERLALWRLQRPELDPATVTDQLTNLLWFGIQGAGNRQP